MNKGEARLLKEVDATVFESEERRHAEQALDKVAQGAVSEQFVSKAEAFAFLASATKQRELLRFTDECSPYLQS